ncbi:MAG TPA: flagellar hook assembly protein FlgD [Arenibaculum sp.]|nr:flagellar hook assembly protein FlgD [Arenibaculum sp.]
MSSIATAAADQTAAGATQLSRAKLSDSYDNFLKLLTTQLQYQDPLQPMDSAEFTNQLVLYSQVEQQISQNEKLDQLLATQNASQARAALGFIGLDVEMDVLEFVYDEEPVQFAYHMPEDVADGAKVTIKDAETGKVLAVADAETKMGSHEFTWDGKNKEGEYVRAGTYRIEVSATDADEAVLSIPTTTFGKVSGIETEKGETFLIILGQRVPIEHVRSAHTPKTAA